MSNEQIIGNALAVTNLIIGVVILLAAYGKMPEPFQTVFKGMRFPGSKTLKILGIIVLAGSAVRLFR